VQVYRGGLTNTETSLDGGATRQAHARAQRRIDDEPGDPVDPFLVRPRQKPVVPVADELARGADARGDDRDADPHVLQRFQAALAQDPFFLR